MAERSRVSIRLTTEAHSGWDRACRIADAAKAIDQERRNRR